MDHIRNINGKYFASEIRRTFKVDFYKKWIDRYDKRAIIFNDKGQTVLWYNKTKMNKYLKVVGTNESSRHLQDKTVEYDIINVESGINACVTQITIDDKKYLFDGKRISLREGKCIIQGMISDNKKFVANISLEFKP
jgi:transcription elongation factor Elf1